MVARRTASGLFSGGGVGPMCLLSDGEMRGTAERGHSAAQRERRRERLQARSDTAAAWMFKEAAAGTAV